MRTFRPTRGTTKVRPRGLGSNTHTFSASLVYNTKPLSRVLKLVCFGDNCSDTKQINSTVDSFVSSTMDTIDQVDWLARVVELSFSLVNQ